MRQLKGKPVKENGKMKRERKKAFKEGHDKVLTVAIPVLVGIVLLIVVYVFSKASKGHSEV